MVLCPRCRMPMPRDPELNSVSHDGKQIICTICGQIESCEKTSPAMAERLKIAQKRSQAARYGLDEHQNPKLPPLVTPPTKRRLRYKIEGHDQSRWDGTTIWQTKQCGPNCPHYSDAAFTAHDDFTAETAPKILLTEGICTIGKAWKIIITNRPDRRIRSCQHTCKCTCGCQKIVEEPLQPCCNYCNDGYCEGQ